MYKRALFGLTRSQQGLKQQKDMLFSAARLHSKLQDQKTTNHVLNLSASKKKKFLRDEMVTQMYELGYKATFSQKHFTLYRTYVLYEDMYFYFVDKFSQEDTSMGEIILTITRLADKYLEHEFDKKGYANIFDFLKEKHHIEDMLRDHLLNDYLTDNSENLKDSQDDWMDKATKALEVTPEEWQKVIKEHTFEEMEKEGQGIYTRWALKRAIMGYALEVENKLDDGKINWDYVAADAGIVYGDEIDTDVIYEVLEEVAHDIDPDRVSYIKFLKKKNP